MPGPSPAIVQRLVVAAIEAFEEKVPEATTSELLSGALTLTSRMVQVVLAMGGSPATVRAGVEEILLHCAPIDKRRLM